MKLFTLAILFSFVGSLSFAASSEPVCVIKKNISLRKGPTSKSAVSWAVPKFMPLLKINQKNGWYQVQDLEGATHWVIASAVSKKINCAVVRTKSAKLRTGPGYDQPLSELERVEKYTPFKKIDRDGEWVQVKDEFDQTYWVHETNIWIPMLRTTMSF